MTNTGFKTAYERQKIREDLETLCKKSYVYANREIRNKITNKILELSGARLFHLTAHGYVDVNSTDIVLTDKGFRFINRWVK